MLTWETYKKEMTSENGKKRGMCRVGLWNFMYSLAERPGVAREKKGWIKFFWEKINRFFLAYNTPRPPLSVHKKFQPNRSCRFAGYRQHSSFSFCVLCKVINFKNNCLQILFAVTLNYSVINILSPAGLEQE